jgi:hypothetical protein
LNLEIKPSPARDLKKTLGKKIDIIIISTDAEKELVKAVVKKHQDKRIINFSSMVEGNELDTC